MENTVSILNRSLTLEEIKETEAYLIDLLPPSELFNSNTSIVPQLVNQIVKVSGNVTVSF